MDVKDFDLPTEDLRKKHHNQVQQGISYNLQFGAYMPINNLLMLFPYELAETLRNMVKDYFMSFMDAEGSSHNHQAWQGGYIDHVTETMNIACQMYWAFSKVERRMPFNLEDVLLVMFLHDLEKPFKSKGKLYRAAKWQAFPSEPVEATKANRRKFRDDMIEEYGIKLTAEQRNALRYVEGIPDSEYVSGEWIMGELAAFCHCCDILSARLWYDWGREHSWSRTEVEDL